MTASEIIEKIKTTRANDGLFIEWMVPGLNGGEEYFTTYPATEESKARMIANGERKGWKRL